MALIFFWANKKIFSEFLKEIGESEEVWSTDGTVLNPDDDLTSVMPPNYTGVLKIVYEK
jgi:hypothetical protein